MESAQSSYRRTLGAPATFDFVTTTDRQVRLSPLIGWAACWLSAVILVGITWNATFHCGSLLERAAVILLLLLTASALALSLWGMSVHKWWFLVIPLVVISLFAFAGAVVAFRGVFFIACAEAL